MNEQEAMKILEFRKQDTKEFQKKKSDFLDHLNAYCLDSGKPNREVIEGMQSKYGNFDTRINYHPKLTHFEMWNLGAEEPIKTNPELCQFINLNANTRLKMISGTCLEIDKLPFNKAVAVLCETMASLIRNKYHFFVWYAEGQRSPHIRIYDLEELEELNPKQRIKAQIIFWQKHVPFGCFHLIDTGIFVDEHPIQLEYAMHWKYGTPFNLLFEYKPKEEEIKLPYPLMFFDGGIKFNKDRKTGKIAYAYVLFSKNGEVISENCLIEDDSTTPKAEYQGLILGLKEIEKQGLDEVRIYGDSELIINQVLGKYRCDNESLKEFYEKAKSLMKNNKIKWIPREKNGYADLLTKNALKEFRKTTKTKIKEIPKCDNHNDLNIKKYEAVGGNWLCPICMK